MHTSFRFWVVLVAALVSASVTASLGFWQLRRADLKERIEAEMQAQQSAAVVHNRDLPATSHLADLTHRSAVLKGTWVASATVFLDNRQMNGRQGFYVVTPLKLTGDGRWILVQRGWAPRDFTDRTRIPHVPTPVGEIVVSGRISTPPAKVYQLGEPDSGVLRQNLDVSAFAQEYGVTVLQGSLVQVESIEGSPPDGLLRDWPRPSSGVHKHHGYAFQWFGLCGLIVVLYVWFQIITPLRRRHEHATPQ